MKKIVSFALVSMVVAVLFVPALPVKADGQNSCTYQPPTEPPVVTLDAPVITDDSNTGGGGGGNGGGGGGGGGSPVYEIAIDSNATSTGTTNVILSLYATGAYAMEFSNTPDFSSGTWELYATTYPWMLTSGDGEKTVYARFSAAGGSELGSAEASIDLVTAPVGQVLGASIFQFTTNLRRGSEGIDVTELQTLLTQEGLYGGPIIGYFGPLTSKAVKAYQLKNGLPATGFVGPLTRAQLNIDLNG